MDLTRILNLQIMFFAIILIGYIGNKTKIIDKNGKKTLTDLVINIILPCNIISAFYIEFSKEILLIGIQMLIISTVVMVGCMIASKFIYEKYPKDKKIVLKYGTVFSNAGFLGNPVAEGLFGSMGLLYASFYLIPQRIFMWSVGVSYFTDMPSKKEVIKKIIKHPCIIASEIGLVLMVTQLKIPIAIENTIDTIGGCTTAITMMLIGAIIGDSDLKKIISKDTIFYSIMRLVIIPTVVLIFCLILKVDETAAGVSVILAAMPAASTTAILASKYDCDEVLGVNCVVLTTLLTVVFVPIWSFVLSYFY